MDFMMQWASSDLAHVNESAKLLFLKHPASRAYKIGDEGRSKAAKINPDLAHLWWSLKLFA